MPVTLPRVFAAVGVDAEVTCWPGFMQAQLRLLEVGGDPDVVERNDRHQLLAGRDVRAHFDRLFADDPVDRRDDGAVAEIEFGLVDQRPSLRHLGLQRTWRAPG